MTGHLLPAFQDVVVAGVAPELYHPVNKVEDLHGVTPSHGEVRPLENLAALDNGVERDAAQFQHIEILQHGGTYFDRCVTMRIANTIAQ
ncbi:hypothetical protein B0A55_12459, partial [Friedmanniomyces simplex]